MTGTEGILVLEFRGELNDKMHGFYRSTYTKRDGTEGFMAASQLESTYAREVFPCLDEPALKATFDVVLRVPKVRLDGNARKSPHAPRIYSACSATSGAGHRADFINE